jgi:hypothetical protein
VGGLFFEPISGSWRERIGITISIFDSRDIKIWLGLWFGFEGAGHGEFSLCCGVRYHYLALCSGRQASGCGLLGTVIFSPEFRGHVGAVPRFAGAGRVW